MAKQSQQLVLMLVIGILIGTAGVMAWKTRTAGTDEEAVNSTVSGSGTATDTVAKTQETIGRGDPSLPLAPSIPKGSRIGLNAQDQLAGNAVSVNGLDIKDTNWVAVYDEREGQPGYIMGATRVHAGDTEAKIELLRDTVQGQRYYVGILGDDSTVRPTSRLFRRRKSSSSRSLPCNTYNSGKSQKHPPRGRFCRTCA
jgi:hypothetical protein